MMFQDFTTGEHRLKCPACGRPQASDRTLGLTVEPDGYIARCFRCDFIEHSRKPRQNLRYVPPPVHGPKPISDFWLEVWRRTRPITEGAPAYGYLSARGCWVPEPGESDLRWIPDLKHPSGYVGPALVALLTDALTREPRTLHRTWIRPDGKKADIEGWCRTNGIEAECMEPRLLAKGGDKKGAVCRLLNGDWEDVAVHLGVAEGIESALSLGHMKLLPWAAVDAGNLAALPVVPGFKSITIAQDQDPAGHKAARSLAARWHQAGREVFLTEQTTNDVNDLIQEGGV